MNDSFDLDEIITDSALWAKFDEFKIAYVDALIEADEVENATEFYDSFKANVWHQVHMNAQFVISGRPRSLDPVVDYLTEAKQHLQTAEGDFSGLASELVAWSGQGATKFKNEYQDKFGPVNANQFVMIGELTGFTLGYRQLMAKARKDFDAMLDSAIAACHSYEKDSGGASGWNTAFKVVGIAAVAAGMVAAALGTGGASLGVGATIIGGFAGFGEAATSPSEGSRSVAFSHPFEILSQLNTVSDGLCETMVGESDKLLRVLTDDLSEIGDGEALIIPRPDVSGLPPNQYLADFPYVGASNDMTVDLLALWMSGTRRLPLVAYSYAKAGGQVSYCDSGINVGLGSADFVGGGVVENLKYLFDVVQARLSEMRDDLVDVGAVFVGIAEAYSATDEGGAAALNALIEEERAYGNLDDVPTSIPTVSQHDIEDAPDVEPESSEAPGGYNPVMPTPPIDTTPLSPGGPYIIVDGPDVDDPSWTTKEEYDPSGRHGGDTRPPGDTDDEDD
ncbi:hypothetical protein [Stackebrandtia soli]|uniref:hypothetical protein n=1 Tax=Stackebrandtia soli TaxID=1892856 RepID=UPI0039EBC1C5